METKSTPMINNNYIMSDELYCEKPSSKNATRSCEVGHEENQTASSWNSPSRRSKLLACLRGILIGVVLFLSSLLGVCCFHAVVGLLLLVGRTHKIYRRLADSMVYSWIMYCTALLEYLLGVRVVVTGDAMLAKERSLIIMNHRTRLDWMYFWSALVRQPAGVMTEKIILKSPLKKIPGAGWAMQVGAFMFIERNWANDQAILKKMITYFADIKHKTQVLLFPEGTDLTANTRKKSDEFARKNNLRPFEYVLHPRTTGFTYLASTMRQENHLDAIYDVTVGYPINIPQRESDLFTGNCAKEVHFHIKRHSVQSLPLTEDGLADWCRSRWQEKEERLKLFYEKGRFESEEDREAGRCAGDGHATKKCCASSVFDSHSVQLRLLFVIAYWTVFMLGIAWLLWVSAFVRYISLFQAVLFIYMGHNYGGFELFQVDYFNRFFNKQRSLKQA